MVLNILKHFSHPKVFIQDADRIKQNVTISKCWVGKKLIDFLPETRGASIWEGVSIQINMVLDMTTLVLCFCIITSASLKILPIIWR